VLVVHHGHAGHVVGSESPELDESLNHIFGEHLGGVDGEERCPFRPPSHVRIIGCQVNTRHPGDRVVDGCPVEVASRVDHDVVLIGEPDVRAKRKELLESVEKRILQHPAHEDFAPVFRGDAPCICLGPGKKGIPVEVLKLLVSRLVDLHFLPPIGMVVLPHIAALHRINREGLLPKDFSLFSSCNVHNSFGTHDDKFTQTSALNQACF